MKHITQEISHPLSVLINKSFSTGTVPNLLKLAKVIPVYKSKDKQLLNNYRPISLLPAVSKIMENLYINDSTVFSPLSQFSILTNMVSDRVILHRMLLMNVLMIQ